MSCHAQHMQASILAKNTPLELAARALAIQLADEQRQVELVACLKQAIREAHVQKTAAILEKGYTTFGPIQPLTMIQAVSEEVFQIYQEKGIDDQIRDATLTDIPLWADEYASAHQGELGLSQVNWISRHLCSAILRLGRLQFEPKPFNAPFFVFQEGDRELLVASGGLSCDQFGYLCNDTEMAFETVFEKKGNAVHAHPVDPLQGCIASKPKWFDLSSYRKILDCTTAVLHVHIPKGKSLDNTSVQESFDLAGKQFPSFSFCTCTSWLLDPSLDQVAQQQSNIVRFMRRFSKFPVLFDVPQIYERVFGFGLDEKEVRAFTSATSLQRNIQNAMDRGIVFRTMGGYCPIRN